MAQSGWLPPFTSSVALARRFVEEAAPGLPPNLLGALRLLVSELATNAVCHSKSKFIVRLWFEPEAGHVKLEVLDCGAGEPELADPPFGETGRGLRIVERLASDWGWARRPDGKVVWCAVELAG